MKIIITESKLQVLALDWLDKMYGGFRRGRYIENEDKYLVPFVKDDAIIFEANSVSGEVYVDKSIWSYLEILFGFGLKESEFVLSKWMNNLGFDFQHDVGMCDFKYSSAFTVDDDSAQN